MKTSEVIKTIIMPRLATPEQWIKGDYAMDRQGNNVWPWQPEAICFCISGACQVLPEEADEYLRAFITRAIGRLHPGYLSIPDFNDDPETTFEDVQQVLKLAYELALAEGR